MGSIAFYTPSDLVYSIMTTTLYIIVFILVFYKITKIIKPFIVKPILEKRISDIIPFFKLHKENILQLKNSDLVSVIELNGLDYTPLSEKEIENITVSRYTLFKDLGITGCKFKIFVSKAKEGNQFTLKEHPIRLLKDIFKRVHNSSSNAYDLKYDNYIHKRPKS